MNGLENSIIAIANDEYLRLVKPDENGVLETWFHVGLPAESQEIWPYFEAAISNRKFIIAAPMMHLAALQDRLGAAAEDKLIGLVISDLMTVPDEQLRAHFVDFLPPAAFVAAQAC